MNITVLTDIHGNTGNVHAISADIRGADLVLITGDITHFGGAKEAREVIGAVFQYNDSILAISGNCDYPEVDQYLTAENINLNKQMMFEGELGYAGLGGSLETPFNTPNEYTDEDYEQYLNQIMPEKPDAFPFILASHHPPYKTLNDKVMYMKHVGSKSVRNFIEQHGPLACFCGHIHEAKGKDSIGNTRIINPGSLRSGFYATAAVNHSDIEVSFKKAES